jgi:hypothetical protein
MRIFNQEYATLDSLRNKLFARRKLAGWKIVHITNGSSSER